MKITEPQLEVLRKAADPELILYLSRGISGFQAQRVYFERKPKKGKPVDFWSEKVKPNVFRKLVEKGLLMVISAAWGDIRNKVRLTEAGKKLLKDLNGNQSQEAE
jgi:hypothetical protein